MMGNLNNIELVRKQGKIKVNQAWKPKFFFIVKKYFRKMSDEVEQRFPAKQRKKKILTTGSQTKVTWFKKW